MNMIFAIFLGGGAGAVARHFVILFSTKVWGDTFPAGTLLVNVIGSFLIGVLIEGSALKWNIPLETRALLVTGFLGGFTTFSSFSLDVYKLAETGQVATAAVYAGLSFAFSIAAVFGGVYLIRGVMQ